MFFAILPVHNNRIYSEMEALFINSSKQKYAIMSWNKANIDLLSRVAVLASGHHYIYNIHSTKCAIMQCLSSHHPTFVMM